MSTYKELRNAALFNLGPAFGDFVGPWFEWFAWRPIKTYNGRTAWLRKVWKRRVQAHDYLSGPNQGSWWWYCLENPIWKRIETAPKDGTKILASGGNPCTVVWWKDGHWLFWENTPGHKDMPRYLFYYPEYWTDLPNQTPPIKSNEGE